MSLPAAFRRLLPNLALALASLAFCFLVGEIALRAIGYAPLRQRPIYRVSDKGDLEIRERATVLDCYSSNPRGYFQIDLRQPDTREAWARRGLRDLEKVAQTYPFCVEFSYNGLGFRERQVGPKPAGARRVAFVGDSFTEAMGIRESDGYVRVVERLLNRPGGSAWESRNFGHRGYDFPALLESFELALATEPDVVVYAMVLNDGDRSQALDRRWPRLDDWVMVRRPIAAPGPLDSRLLTLIDAEGYPHLLRLWNYFPGIGDRHDHIDRYMVFSRGRHRAIEAHRGFVFIDSDTGGTRVTVLLPASQADNGETS